MKKRETLLTEIFLVTLLLALSGRWADVATTYLVLSSPSFYERNPFMTQLLKNPPLFIAVQTAGGFCIWALLWIAARHLKKHGCRVASMFLWLAVVISWLPVPHNLMVYFLGFGFLYLPYPSLP